MVLRTRTYNTQSYIIDTHAHIYEDIFKDDIEQLIGKFEGVGIRKIVMPTTSLEDVNKALQLQNKYLSLFSVLIGIHPDNVTEDYKKQLEGIVNFLKEYNFIGIGEIGLDYCKSPTPREVQKAMFTEQLLLARKYSLPVSIHVRDAFNDCYDILKQQQDGKLKGIIHCFSGSTEDARRYTSLGFKLGIGGIVTFKNSTLASILENISLQDIVLETDSPFLAPEPYRGKRNDPSYLVHIIKKLASIYKVSEEEVVENTFQNSCDVFSFDKTEEIISI